MRRDRQAGMDAAARVSLTRNDPAYWTAIKEGDYLSLSDYLSFAKAGAGGLDYRVADVRRIRIADRGSGKALAEYHLHELAREDSANLYFLVVVAGTEFELRLYLIPAAFATGTRDQLVDRGQTWLFLPPPDPEDFLSSELEYAPFPDLPPIAEEGSGAEGASGDTPRFAAMGFGKPVYGSYERGGEEVPVILCEYAAEEGLPYPLLLVIEERWVLGDGTVPEEGGLVTTMIGSVIERGSVEIYPS